MQDQLEIRVDGILQEPTIAERTGSMVMDVLKSTISATYEASKRVLGECATSLALDITDAREGTHLRQEWVEKRRAARIASIEELHPQVISRTKKYA